ncbi:hypothetical protein CLOSBL3_10520 [Clostridiaceae bacterium BL-3]|mgnify:CR=1 FL=1|jgi:regulator of replication initiation timing|nr:hypothetical protein CLOSBL3_10520 [Clostridiaceae bacterium BL-3]
MKEITYKDIDEIKEKLDTIIKQNDSIKLIIDNFDIPLKNKELDKNKTTEEFLRKFMDEN